MENTYSQDELKNLGFKKLGENVLISKRASILNHKEISIGNNVVVSDYCTLDGNITIKDNVKLPPHTALFAHENFLKIEQVDSDEEDKEIPVATSENADKETPSPKADNKSEKNPEPVKANENKDSDEPKTEKKAEENKDEDKAEESNDTKAEEDQKNTKDETKAEEPKSINDEIKTEEPKSINDETKDEEPKDKNQTREQAATTYDLSKAFLDDGKFEPHKLENQKHLPIDPWAPKEGAPKESTWEEDKNDNENTDKNIKDEAPEKNKSLSHIDEIFSFRDDKFDIFQ